MMNILYLHCNQLFLISEYYYSVLIIVFSLDNNYNAQLIYTTENFTNMSYQFGTKTIKINSTILLTGYFFN